MKKLAMENKKPFLSIIIGTYNGARRIGRLLDSLFSQNFDDFEVIVVDDHSTDDTKDVIESYQKSNLKFLEKVGPRGLYLSRQQGLCAATGFYVVVMDDDDYVNDRYFSSLSSAVVEYSGDLPTALITTVKIEAEGQEICVDGRYFDVPTDRSSFADGKNAWRTLLSFRYGSWRLAFNREYLLKTGYTFEAGELPLFAKLFDDDCRCVFVPEAIYYYVQRPESLSHDLKKTASFNSSDSTNKTFEFNDKIALNCKGKKRRMIESYILKSLYPPYIIRGLNDDEFSITKSALKNLKKVYHYRFLSMLGCLPYFSKRTWKSCFVVMFGLGKIAWKLLKRKANI